MEDKEKTFKKRRWHTPFLEAVSKFGTVTAACTASGVSRQTIYRELAFPQFGQLLQDAHRRNRDILLLRISQMASGADSTPKSVSLAAAQFLIQRADRRLHDDDRAASGPTIPQGDDVMTITITPDLATRLFPVMRSLAQPTENLPIVDESEPNTAGRKPN